MLLVGERVVLRAPSPPEAEYALFDVAEIELRASEPGRVREHGYQTTAARALRRLAQLGITAARARQCGSAMQPVLSDAYARGPAVRSVARYLGPLELLQSDVFDPDAQAYRGVFVDLPILARDLGLPEEYASFTLQALYLSALLEAEAPETIVFLSTAGFTRSLKPGERTHKRPALGDPGAIVDALERLSQLEPHPAVKDHLARADVLAFLRARIDAAHDADIRALYESLEQKIALREMPPRGPLADPALWAVETRIESNRTEGVVAAIDAIERTHGRTPGTTYLRAHAALVLGTEPPKLIAERMSALALSMASFHELSLLAARAWLDAGDGARALPYARDLVEAPGVDEGVRLHAERLFARAAGALPEEARRTFADSIPAPLPPSQPPISVPTPDPCPSQALPPAKSRVPTVKGAGPSDPPPSGLPHDDHAVEAPAAPRASSLPPARPKPAAGDVLPSSLPPPLDLELTPPPMIYGDPKASFTLELPSPAEIPHAPEPAPRVSSAPPPRRSAAPRLGVVTLETRPPPRFDPRAEPESEQVPATMSLAAEQHATPTRRLSSPAPRRTPGGAAAAAALPAYQTERPPPLLSSPPPATTRRGSGDDLAEQLALPDGFEGDPTAIAIAPRPESVLEARVKLTLLARELGRDYRLHHGVALRADLRGIESMQAVLMGTFPDRAVTTKEQEDTLVKHGALLSEILARRLGAEWVDIAPEDIWRWAMIVPPDTRVWPFGRIARLVVMGHSERDLVSYFLELTLRARPG